MIPEGWHTLLLSEICRPKQWPTISKELFEPEGYPVYGANGQIGYYSDFNHEEETIAITCRGATCGTINWVPAYSYITGNAMALDNVRESDVDKKFLFYSLNHWGVKDSISGSAQPQITGQSLSKVAFPFPALSEQKRIAEVLGGVDAAIDATKAVIEQTKKVKQGLLQALLTRGISHTNFQDSPLGKIPERWEVKALSDLCLRKGEYGANAAAIDYKVGLPRYIRITDIDNQGELLKNTMKGITLQDAESYILEEDDFLFARSGATVGKTYRHKPCNGLCAFAGYMIRFKTDKDRLMPAFLEEITRSENYRTWIKDTLRAGAQPNINAQEYGAMLIALPPVPEQWKIMEVLEGINNQLTAETAKLASLQQLKKGLMHDLLTGKVRVA
ncbi:MAG: restriction endonuclease subunit S [Pseudomonadota bacterium]|nr:restriction endonuclease subunit S [Pseudomonadota bacterium]